MGRREYGSISRGITDQFVVREPFGIGALKVLAERVRFAQAAVEQKANTSRCKLSFTFQAGSSKVRLRSRHTFPQPTLARSVSHKSQFARRCQISLRGIEMRIVALPLLLLALAIVASAQTTTYTTTKDGCGAKNLGYCRLDVTDQLNHPFVAVLDARYASSGQINTLPITTRTHVSAALHSSWSVLGIRAEPERDAPRLLWRWVVSVRRWHGRRSSSSSMPTTSQRARDVDARESWSAGIIGCWSGPR